MARRLPESACGSARTALWKFWGIQGAVLIDNVNVEALAGRLHHDVLGGLSQLRHALQRLAQRRRSQREPSVAVIQLRTLLVRRRRIGRSPRA